MPRTVQAFNARLGARIRAARLASHLSQETLAMRLGVSFQQIQKYELGKDRVSVEMLVRLAKVLGRPLTDFVDEADETEAPTTATPDLRRALKTAEQIGRLPMMVQRRLLALLDTLIDFPIDEAAPLLAEAA